ncbi:MAG: AarF/ABC1/UbiB kinase family protein [Candidatus Omnitrophica bacterium]|nr:AarF/ABC1/UbiB kinase family protein [Candidatus Omnitrophota bacterium]MCM8807413.1 AarF/ABC1/UbiB kinase family protein [Candidatus Omnitrophota bacterium]
MRKYPSIRKFRRYRELINILIKYGFGIIIEKLHLLKIPFRKKKKIEYSIPVRIKKILEELGPTYIKMGQILSTRPDLVPLEYIKELEKLQDEVKEEDFEVMKKTIENEIGNKIENIFEEFEPVPIASASLSCVYKAKYKGEYVAVKVQRPNIKEQIYTDIQILYDIAELIEKFIEGSELYQPLKIVQEFEKSIKKELNFLIECKNIEAMREKIKDERLLIPYVYKELCTEKLLILEYIDGIKISKVDEWSKYVDKMKVLKNGIDIILKQIFEVGFFHGDPHPGNIFILKDGRIALIDFGIVGKLDDEKKYYLLNLITGIIKGRSDKIISTLKAMGSIDRKTDIEELKNEIEDVIDTYKNVPLKNIKIGEIIETGFDVMRKHKVKIPVSFSLIGKSMITLEGICHFIAPEFRLIDSIEPIFLEFLEKKIKFNYYLKEVWESFDRFQHLIKEIPESFENFLNTIKEKNERKEIIEEKIEELTGAIRKTGIKLSISLIIFAVLLSSIILFLSNYFYSGITGFIITFILLGILFLLILRE